MRVIPKELNVKVVVSFDDVQQFWEAYAIVEGKPFADGKIFPTCRSRLEGAAVSYALTEAAIGISRGTA